MIMICRISLIPPAVEPAEPPENISPKNTTVRNGVQPVKSALTKPVVVTTETTWNNACLKALSASPAAAFSRAAGSALPVR